MVNGQAEVATADHDEWVLVAQDCDLAWNSVIGSDSLVELRPVYREDPPENWGIRDSRFRLDEDGAHLKDTAPAVRVTPDVVMTAEHTCTGHTEPVRRLKTWLGLRYNRPAIPQEYAQLAQDVAKRLRKKSHRRAEERVRDILATFTTAASDTVEFAVVAVVPHELAAADPSLLGSTRDWLSKIALATPSTLGLATDVLALTDEQVSLAFLETSYALDVSLVSWPNTDPGFVGAAG